MHESVLEEKLEVHVFLYWSLGTTVKVEFDSGCNLSFQSMVVILAGQNVSSTIHYFVELIGASQTYSTSSSLHGIGQCTFSMVD